MVASSAPRRGLLLALLTPRAIMAADWLAKRAAVLSTVWSDGAIPTARTAPDYARPSNYSGVSWLAWDISAPGAHPMNATAWFEPIDPHARSRDLCLVHQGHAGLTPGTRPVALEFAQWVHRELAVQCSQLDRSDVTLTSERSRMILAVASERVPSHVLGKFGISNSRL